MNQSDRLTKRLSAALVCLLAAALFLQGCGSSMKIIGNTAKLIMTETAEGREADDPEQAQTAPASREDREAAEEKEPAARTEPAGQEKASGKQKDAPRDQGAADQGAAEQAAAAQTQAAGEGDKPDKANVSLKKKRNFEVVPKETFDSELEKGVEAYGARPFLASLVTWHGKPAAVDELESTVYVPCSAEDGEYADWDTIVGKLAPASKDEKILYLKEDRMEQIGEAVREGYSFEAILSSGQGITRFRVVLTGLPVLSITKTDLVPVTGKEDHTGYAVMIDTKGLLRSSDCTFHVRGNYAADFDKKPYKVSLKKKNGKKNKMSWLGLRKDDDWILNPLYTDMSKVREVTAYQVWEQVTALAQNACPSSRVKYVEVLMDNSYHGIYALTEPVDAKQLKENRFPNQISFTDSDLLYKINLWNQDYPYLDLYASSAGKIEILTDFGKACVEIRYPKEWNADATWEPMHLFQDFVFRSRDRQALDRAGVEVDIDSVVTLSLFCALTHATDNTWKNTLLIAKRVPAGQGQSGADAGENRWILYRDIWDLNYVFGDIYDADQAQRYTAFSMEGAQQYRSNADTTYDFETYALIDPGVQGMLADKWAKWRDSGISADSVCGIVDDAFGELAGSGALGREMNRWPQTAEPDAAVSEMKEWIRVRFAYLDGRFSYVQGTETGNEREE